MNFPSDEIEKLAQRWFKLNAGKLYDEHWELALTFYLLRGKLMITPLVRGAEAEVEIPEPPKGGDPVGSLHTHVGSTGEFSDYDMEEGQKMANMLGHPYLMFVVGPDDDEGGMVMSSELFEPDIAENKSPLSLKQAMQTATAEILNDPRAVAYYGEKGKPGYRETPQGVTNWKNLPAFQGRRREDVIERKSPADVVNSLLEADDDLDPEAYMMSLRRKRDVVQDLIKRYAVRHRWDYGEGERVTVTFPKDLDFKKLLADHGVAPQIVIGISGGNKNYRLQFYWKPGELDGLTNK